MTIARRRALSLGTAPEPAAPQPPPSVVRPQRLPIGLPLPVGDVPAVDAVTPVGRLRRCIFRRIDRLTPLPQRGGRAAYEVMCLYGTEAPLSLGEVIEARPVCEACRAPGIFRPDEA